MLVRVRKGNTTQYLIIASDLLAWGGRQIFLGLWLKFGRSRGLETTAVRQRYVLKTATFANYTYISTSD